MEPRPHFDHHRATNDELYQFIQSTPPDELASVKWGYNNVRDSVECEEKEDEDASYGAMLHFLAGQGGPALFKLALDKCDYITCLTTELPYNCMTPIDVAADFDNLCIVRIILDVYPDCQVSNAIRIAFRRSCHGVLLELINTPQGRAYISSKHAQHVLLRTGNRHSPPENDYIPVRACVASHGSYHHDIYTGVDVYNLLHDNGFVFEDIRIPLIRAIGADDIDVFMTLLDRYNVTCLDPETMNCRCSQNVGVMRNREEEKDEKEDDEKEDDEEDDDGPTQYEFNNVNTAQPCSLLHMACWRGRIDFIAPILARMSPTGIRYQQHNGYTALHIAVIHMNTACASAVYNNMTSHGRTLMDNFGNTASHYITSYSVTNACQNPSYARRIFAEMFAHTNTKGAQTE